MKNALLIFTILVTVNSSKLNAQTNVSGGIFSNTTWTLANSPYIVTDTLTLFPGVTLTIDPGVVTKFYNQVPFYVRGTIYAVGTAVDSIFFISNSASPTQNSWSGVRVFTQLGAIVTLKYFKMMHASNAFHIESGGNGSLSITHCTFEKNRNGIAGNGGVIIVDSCHFISNHSGVGDGSSVGGFTVTNSVLKNNVIGFDYSQGLNATNCTFIGNQIGLFVWDGMFQNCTIMCNGVGISPANSNGLNLQNSTVALNDTGIVLATQGSAIIHQNNICNNVFYNVIRLGPYNENLSNNCWCDTVPANISQKIYDGYDNVALGLITFLPFISCDTTVLPVNSCSAFTNITPIENQKNSIGLYPNPMQEYSILKMDKELRNAQITITSLTGQNLLKLINQNGNEFTFYKQNFPHGLYFVNVSEQGKAICNLKLIIL